MGSPLFLIEANSAGCNSKIINNIVLYILYNTHQIKHVIIIKNMIFDEKEIQINIKYDKNGIRNGEFMLTKC